MTQRWGLWLVVLFILSSAGTAAASDKAYVGAEACRDCHEKEYDRFMAYSKKARSFDHIKKMEKKLSPEEYKACFGCHTTGYGKEGGFVSETGTPALKNAGCEVCHGPKSLHIESQDPEDIIGEVDRETCMTCHNQDRVSEFDFNPLLFGGAH